MPSVQLWKKMKTYFRQGVMDTYHQDIAHSVIVIYRATFLPIHSEARGENGRNTGATNVRNVRERKNNRDEPEKESFSLPRVAE